MLKTPSHFPALSPRFSPSLVGTATWAIDVLSAQERQLCSDGGSLPFIGTSPMQVPHHLRPRPPTAGLHLLHRAPQWAGVVMVPWWERERSSDEDEWFLSSHTQQEAALSTSRDTSCYCKLHRRWLGMKYQNDMWTWVGSFIGRHIPIPHPLSHSKNPELGIYLICCEAQSNVP